MKNYCLKREVANSSSKSTRKKQKREQALVENYCLKREVAILSSNCENIGLLFKNENVDKSKKILIAMLEELLKKKQ